MDSRLNYPFDPHELLRKKRGIRRTLLERAVFEEKRIAILGGSTTAEIKDMLELFLLDEGIRAVFYESDYNRYFEDAVFDNPELDRFTPDVVYIHTTGENILYAPTVSATPREADENIERECARFRSVWDHLSKKYACAIIQNNFELPHYRILGNLDCYDHRGRTRHVSELNRLFSAHARSGNNLHINDINYLSAWFGLERWYDKLFWYSYKYAMNYEAIPLLAHSIAAIIKALYGKAKKCLVLDLDNTIWGGVIGDDGVAGIRIGRETPEAEAYLEFQRYVKELNGRGIVLAVSSKNDTAAAHEGLSHPDSILQLADFSSFRANWEPKSDNVREIARELNLGRDSLVFVDDNPAERDIVRRREPEISVPELGDNVARYINVIDKSGYFETVSLSRDDLERTRYYSNTAGLVEEESRFTGYDDFLQSLAMVAEIREFSPAYLDRITQLTNKTNQFNLTTRRYTAAEIAAVAADSSYIALCGRLRDKFGDHGLVSVIIGKLRADVLHIELWLMSCRVLKRGMEAAMFDVFTGMARAKGVKTIIGYYLPTPKNGMVSSLFPEVGFIPQETGNDGATVWRYDPNSCSHRNTFFIEVEK